MTDKLLQALNRVAELEEALGQTSQLSLKRLLKPAIYLRACEPMLGLRLARQTVSRDAAFTVLYGDRPESDQPDVKIIDIIVLRLRTMLQPYQVRITSDWGQGYYMTADDKRRCRELLERLRREEA